MSIYTCHKDVLISVNSTHSSITQIITALSAPMQVKGYFLAFFRPQECRVNEMNFVFQLENSIQKEQAIMESKLHEEV